MITLKEIHERDTRPPSVTVNMVCYNHEKYLDEAIRGVLMQKTNFPVNIVIHDDASTDRSAEIIRRYASENPNITAIIEETNYVQNGKEFFPKVLPYLTGKYIAYCECDDFWIDENKLQIQVDYLESNPDCSMVCSNTLPVNKYSQYDESCRSPWNPKMEEGDYPKWYLFGIKNQLASFLLRNFWQFMTPEEIDFYIRVKANGDGKILALCLGLGRVHYLGQELSAYRHIIDEGISYSALKAKKTKYELYCFYSCQEMERYRLVEHFFGKRYYRKYLWLLFRELRGSLEFRRSVIKDANLTHYYKEIPWFVWPCFPFYALHKVVRKIVKILFRIK